MARPPRGPHPLGPRGLRPAAGPVSVWDRATVLDLNLPYGTLASVSGLALFAGANTFAVETEPGVREVLQVRDAILVSAGRNHLTVLLRGQPDRSDRDMRAAPCLTDFTTAWLDQGQTAPPTEVQLSSPSDADPPARCRCTRAAARPAAAKQPVTATPDR
jgi:hypothetical protein